MKTNYHLVKEYFETLNLGDYDLGGCEFTDEDFRNIAVKWECSGKGLEEVVDEYLYQIRKILDDGLVETEDSNGFVEI